MKKSILLLLALIITGCAAQTEMANKNKQSAPDISQVCFDQSCFAVEIADNAAKRALGLMNRNNLAPENGMLFIFETNSVYKFWMKNTLIPLDIIWLDDDKKVVFISENTQPCQTDPCPNFGPDEPALYVLEINGRLAEINNLTIGAQAIFK